jgi:hypothetical protein
VTVTATATVAATLAATVSVWHWHCLSRVYSCHVGNASACLVILSFVTMYAFSGPGAIINSCFVTTYVLVCLWHQCHDEGKAAMRRGSAY